MTWLKTILAPLLTSITLLIGMGVAYGELDSRQQAQQLRLAELSGYLSGKVNRDEVTRELDQIHRDLGRIERRLDGVIIRPAIVAEP